MKKQIMTAVMLSFAASVFAQSISEISPDSAAQGYEDLTVTSTLSGEVPDNEARPIPTNSARVPARRSTA